MKRLTAEWAQKAEDDFVVAQKMYRARKRPVYDAVCFHAQQCAEKYLKAFLQEHGRDIPKIHKLLDLLKLCKEVDASLEFLVTDLKELERFSVNVRYPGVSAEKDEAKFALKSVKAVRDFFRQRLRIA
ncbi:MAG: HEPN domain-containing protein [Anaerolineales bacterium]|nr:HEPN domain-containing protein [Anaerolineales bacterium]